MSPVKCRERRLPGRLGAAGAGHKEAIGLLGTVIDVVAWRRLAWRRVALNKVVWEQVAWEQVVWKGLNGLKRT